MEAAGLTANKVICKHDGEAPKLDHQSEEVDTQNNSQRERRKNSFAEFTKLNHEEMALAIVELERLKHSSTHSTKFIDRRIERMKLKMNGQLDEIAESDKGLESVGGTEEEQKEVDQENEAQKVAVYVDVDGLKCAEKGKPAGSAMSAISNIREMRRQSNLELMSKSSEDLDLEIKELQRLKKSTTHIVESINHRIEKLTIQLNAVTAAVNGGGEYIPDISESSLKAEPLSSVGEVDEEEQETPIMKSKSLCEVDTANAQGVM